MAAWCTLFDEFAGKHEEHLGTGDVKYHMGFSSDFQTDGGLVHLALAFNPSHLEIVSPVVIGSVRARLDRLDEPSSNKVLPITIHGDAAVTGQGVVQETLNMSKARGYHLEIVSPVVIGSVRARLDRLDEPSSNKVLPITIHGDAAVTGQGVVQDTLNMSKARG